MATHHFIVIPLGQPGNDLNYNRVAVRNTNLPKQAVIGWLAGEREKGSFPTKVHIRRSRASSAPFAPKFEEGSDIFVYPTENGTGTPTD